MRNFFNPFLFIFFLENGWAQDPDTLLTWHIPQTPPTSEFLVDDGSALQSGASLLAQADQLQPNSLTDQTTVTLDNNIWDSNELLDCVSDKRIKGRAGPASQQPRPRRARRWKKRDQQPAMCSQTGPTYMQPKIAPDLIKNPSLLPVNPAESGRFRIPVFPGSDARKGDNPTCLQKTLGWLPLGICDSGVASDRYESIFDVYGVAASLDGQVTTGLDNCVLGASSFCLPYSSVPVPTTSSPPSPSPPQKKKPSCCISLKKKGKQKKKAKS